MQQQGAMWNWLGGITMIVLAGVVLSNGKNLATIFKGLGDLYSAAAGAAHAGGATAQK